MKTPKALIARLEKEFDIAIFDFKYFSGESYKAEFYFRKTDELKPYCILRGIKIKTNETYRQALQRII